MHGKRITGFLTCDDRRLCEKHGNLSHEYIEIAVDRFCMNAHILWCRKDIPWIGKCIRVQKVVDVEDDMKLYSDVYMQIPTSSSLSCFFAIAKTNAKILQRVDVCIKTESEYSTLLEILPLCTAIRTLKIVLLLKEQTLHALAQSISRNRLEVLVIHMSTSVVDQSIYWELIGGLNLPVLQKFSVKWNYSQNDQQPLLYLMKNSPLLECVAVYAPNEEVRTLANMKQVRLQEPERVFGYGFTKCLDNISYLDLRYVDRKATSFQNASDLVQALGNVKEVQFDFLSGNIVKDSITALIDLYGSICSHANIQSVVLTYGQMNLPKSVNGVIINALYKEKPLLVCGVLAGHLVLRLRL